MARLQITAAALLAACISVAPMAQAEGGGWFGATVEAPSRDGDAAIAAGSLTIVGRIGGDALVAAGDARLNGAVAGDLRIATGTYRQFGAVGGELSIAAGRVEINGEVGDDLYVFSGDVNLGEDAFIVQDARIIGQDVLVKGRIDGDVDITARTVAFAGQVAGNVTIRAEKIVIGEGATIDGRLIWQAPEAAEVAPEAIIRGGVSGQIGDAPNARLAVPWRGPSPEAAFIGAAMGRTLLGLSAFLLGALLVWLTPGMLDRTRARLPHHWAPALGWGALTMFATPVALLVLLVTLIGAPIALAGLLAYPFLLLLGFTLGCGALGALALLRAKAGRWNAGSRLAAVAIGALAITGLSFLPWIGWLFGLAATVLGLGLLAVDDDEPEPEEQVRTAPDAIPAPLAAFHSGEGRG